jgi:hypothetical protein
MDLANFKTSDYRYDNTKVACSGYSCALKVQIGTFAYQLELSIVAVSIIDSFRYHVHLKPGISAPKLCFVFLSLVGKHFIIARFSLSLSRRGTSVPRPTFASQG